MNKKAANHVIGLMELWGQKKNFKVFRKEIKQVFTKIHQQWAKEGMEKFII